MNHRYGKSSFAYYIENRGIAGTGSDIELVYKHIHDTERKKATIR